MPITITVRRNGPYFIHPDDVSQVRLVDHEGNEIPIPGKSITLCRCGASATKPFCDSSHKRIAFVVAEAAPGPGGATEVTMGIVPPAAPASPPTPAPTPAPGSDAAPAADGGASTGGTPGGAGA